MFLTASGELITCCDAMVMKYTTLCLAALALFGCLCDAQKPIQKPSQPQKPALPPQTKQTFEKPLTWKYPEDPKPDPKIEVEFQMKYPVAASTVDVECRERDARVEVKRDLFGIGQPINPADLTLGNCPAIAEDPVAQVLIFESDLHECGSISMVSRLKKIYQNSWKMLILYLSKVPFPSNLLPPLDA